ncbi:MAG: 2-hydroxyacyl-CoA dehydratase family protein, partial [Dehalococcoidales bacterium]
MANYYYDLLNLCGFEDDEIEKERPRIEKVFQKIGLGSEDMKQAKKWVTEQHDIKLLGMRKVMRVWLLELFDLVLAKEEGKRCVYYGYPSIMGPGAAIKATSKEGDLWVGCPDVVLCHTLGQIFNKLTPILEAGEENGLPPGHGLCSLQQIRVGGMAKGIIPVPDLVTGSSYFCDMGSKTDELLHERYGHRAVYIDGCLDGQWGELSTYHPEKVEFFGAQINKLFDTVKEVLGVEVTKEAFGKAMAMRTELYSKIAELGQLMTADPLPISDVESSMAIQLLAASTGRAMTEGPEAIDMLCLGIKERVDKGIGVVEKGAPRVLNFFPPFSDPRIAHMMEKVGLAVSMGFSSPPPQEPEATTFPTLGEELAYLAIKTGGYHSMFGMASRFEERVRRLNIDGVIWGYLYNCRPLALGSHLIKQWIEEKTSVPTLSLEIDIYDSRYYSAESLRT